MVWVTEKHHRIIRWTHWINFPALTLMVWSGLLIYWAHQAYITIPDELAEKVHIDHRLAEGMGWHFFIMWIFVINGIIYLITSFVSGHWKEIVPTIETFKKAVPYFLYDLKLSNRAPIYEGKYNPVQRLAYFGAILLGLLSFLSGLAIYKPVQLGWLTWCMGGYKAARAIHFFAMISFVLFFILHIFQVLRAGWNNFRAMVSGYEIEKD